MWQGDLRRKEDAWQLLYFVDAIHTWAISTYKPFIEQHLAIWNEAVERDFLLEWDIETTRDDVVEVRKRYEQERAQIAKSRRDDEGEFIPALLISPYFLPPQDVRLPVWANSLDVQVRRNLSDKAWLLLVGAWEASGQLSPPGNSIRSTKIFLKRKRILEMSVTPETDGMDMWEYGVNTSKSSLS